MRSLLQSLKRATGFRRSVAPPELRYFATLCPSFSHFGRFSSDARFAGIRINSAALSNAEVMAELAIAEKSGGTVPLWFDIKGRQLRVTAVHPNHRFLDISLNHPVSVPVPTPVLFKAGADSALLKRIEEGGTRLIFHDGATHGPHWEVKEGDSLHIRHPALKVSGPQFIEAELAKIETVKKAGFTRYFLSYVQCQRDVDEFRELIGRSSELALKIEDPKGLEYVARTFRKEDGVSLVAARGDLYVELIRPHDILPSLKLIAAHDPEAMVGSRIMLSVVQDAVPSCADFSELAWLYDIGYRRMLLCDEICLKEPLLARAMNAMEAFRQSYTVTT